MCAGRQIDRLIQLVSLQQRGKKLHKIKHTQHLGVLRQMFFQLDHLYLGLSANEKGLIRQLRLKAQALLFVLEMQEITTSKKQ